LMGWRDDFKVHPAADIFPMLPEDELAKLQKDIERHGIRIPIALYDELDDGGRVNTTWLIDGRNRLEAAERAGIDLGLVPVVRVSCSDPVSWIIGLNLRRRHLTKAQQADVVIAAHKAARQEALKLKAYTPEAEAISRQHGEKRRGRKPNKMKAAAVATGKALGISERTIERSLARSAGKKLSCSRRGKAKAERYINGVIGAVYAIGAMTFSEKMVDLLDEQELAELGRNLPKAIASLGWLQDQVRARVKEQNSS
jgi:hypothetical protein